MDRRAAIAFAFALVGGCSLLVDQSGLSGGAASGAPDASLAEDAAAPPADAADARGPEAAPLDAGGSADAGDADARCAVGVHDFCDDFDHGALGAAWSSFSNSGGTLALDSVALSPPSALLTAAQGGGTVESLLLLRTLSGTRGIRCSFDVRVDAYDDFTDVFHVNFATASGSYFVRLVLGAGGDLNEFGQLLDGGERVRNNWLTSQPDAGAWTRIDVDLQLSPDGGTATLSYDGNPMLQERLSPPSDVSGMTIQLGAYNAAAVGWRAHYDDVACDLQR